MSTRRSSRNLKRSSSATGGKSSQNQIEKYMITSNSNKRKQTWLTPPEQSEESSAKQVMKKRQQYHIQDQWRQITECKQITTRTLVPSPVPPTEQVPCHEAMRAAGASCYSFRNIFTCQNSRCPLPQLTWGDAKDVWNIMKAKDEKYTRTDYISRHPQLQYRMRAILLDWIIEVCEVYRLHRETFFLTADFIDRYLSIKVDVQKSQLQLIGVAALFIAAKIEEIYPPKLNDFAYITDGACTESDITTQEIIMLKTLKWDLTPMTVNMWMTVYLNIINNTSQDKETCLTKINYSRHSFVQIAHLMDLAMLDEGSLQFSYGILAASILYHYGDEKTTFRASGLSWSDIEACVSWLAPLAITVREGKLSKNVTEFDNIAPDDRQNIQTRGVTITLLDQAKQRQQVISADSRASPSPSTRTPDVLTPPPTKHKHSSASSTVISNGGASVTEPSLDKLYIIG